jgi:hypothetical protein
MDEFQGILQIVEGGMDNIAGANLERNLKLAQ